MPQKIANTIDAARELMSKGNAKVRAAAKNQWVKLPRDCPVARKRVGKI